MRATTCQRNNDPWCFQYTCFDPTSIDPLVNTYNSMVRRYQQVPRPPADAFLYWTRYTSYWIRTGTYPSYYYFFFFLVTYPQSYKTVRNTQIPFATSNITWRFFENVFIVIIYLYSGVLHTLLESIV